MIIPHFVDLCCEPGRIKVSVLKVSSVDLRLDCLYSVSYYIRNSPV